MVASVVMFSFDPRPAAPCRHAPRPAKSLRLYSFADPHPLNPVVSIRYEKGGGEGVSIPTCKPSNVPTFRRVFERSPFLSNSCELFCTQQKLNSFLFNQFRTLCQKPPGVGGGAIFSCEEFPRSTCPHLVGTSQPLFPQHSNLQHSNVWFSVHSSKFRMPQLLCLPLLRKHRGVGVFFPLWNAPCAPNGSLYFPLCPVRDSQSAPPTI